MPFPRNNLESWVQIKQFIEELPETDHWPKWKALARNLITELELTGLNSSFRIGQSVHYIIISTLGEHRLLDEPRVTISIDPEQIRVHVTYSRLHIEFNPPELEEWLSPPDAAKGIIEYLKKLWIETKPGEDLPVGLKKAS